MEVILLEKINKLGNIGACVTVAPGYGRNFLLPRNKAVRATGRNKRMVSEKLDILNKENEQKRSHALEIKEKIDGQEFKISREAGKDGRLYGSVTANNIVAAIFDLLGYTIDRSSIAFPVKIKQLGQYVASLELYPEIVANIAITVERNIQTD